MKLEELKTKLEEDVKGPLTRAALFHDISGFGKCSLTTALPILSAAGIEGSCIPTAVLSTHTGGFENFTFRDLTEDLPAFLKHWNDLDIHFDSIYSGYLGSPDQAKILEDFIDVQKEKNPEIFVYVDPVMADDGKLYPGFTDEMVKAMRGVVKKADVIVPNMTEASFLLDIPYKEGPYTKDYITEVAKKLQDFGPQTVIISGLELENGNVGTALYKDGKLTIAEVPLIPGQYHGSGDVFGAFLLAALLNGLSYEEAIEIASYFTYAAIYRTRKRETPRRDGVDFESLLPEFSKELGLL